MLATFATFLLGLAIATAFALPVVMMVRELRASRRRRRALEAAFQSYADRHAADVRAELQRQRKA